MKTAVFTIGSRNYWAFVKTLMNSLKETNPEWDRYVGCADSIDTIDGDDFTIISDDELLLPCEKDMKFRYSIMEYNTAIKPFVFKYLFDICNYDRVIYLDPDIFVYEKMNVVEEMFDKGYHIVLIPHLTKVYNDDFRPNLENILCSGIYNLGFLALEKSLSTKDLLGWWAKKLEKQCIVDIEHGIFVDQKWMDLVPGLYKDAGILHHEGCNVAYWNLSNKAVRKQDGMYYFNDDPLIFFHFSGINPQSYSNVSKHQNRLTIDDLGLCKELFDNYANEVMKNGYAYYNKIPYAYNYFTDGSFIKDGYRKLYSSCDDIYRLCGSNPFCKADLFVAFEIGTSRTVPNGNSLYISEQRANKFVKYFNLLITWMQNANALGNVEDFFERHRFKSIAIYGAGKVGMLFYDLIKESKKFEVKYFIDRSSKKLEEVKVYTINQKFPDVDVIVVSAIFDYENIKMLLGKKTKSSIVSLEDVIRNAN